MGLISFTNSKAIKMIVTSPFFPLCSLSTLRYDYFGQILERPDILNTLRVAIWPENLWNIRLWHQSSICRALFSQAPPHTNINDRSMFFARIFPTSSSYGHFYILYKERNFVCLYGHNNWNSAKISVKFPPHRKKTPRSTNHHTLMFGFSKKYCSRGVLTSALFKMFNEWRFCSNFLVCFDVAIISQQGTAMHQKRLFVTSEIKRLLGI